MISMLPEAMNNGLTMQQNFGVLTSIWAGVEAIKLLGFHVAFLFGLL